MDIGNEDIYVVIGSGCTGAMAAQTLVEKGVKVLMMDVGNHDEKYANILPQTNFTDLRKNDMYQYKYWLGEDFESIGWGKTTTGAQLTPSRKHMVKGTAELLSVVSDNFSAMESLSYGGLGNGWGVGCCVFSDEELKAAGLLTDKMREAYQVVADRIGISEDKDDTTPYTAGNLNNLQKAEEIDNNSNNIYKKYTKKKSELNSTGFYLGKPALALLTEKKDDRMPVDYTEMDFYSDKNQSAYRPWITINNLKKKPNFKYLPNALLYSFKEETGSVTLTYINTSTNEKKTIKCKKLVICAGTLSTARIVLRSIDKSIQRLPFLCNPYKYFTLLQTSLLGKATEEPRSAFAQLAMYYDPSHTNYEVSAASIYSYRSLMLFRTIKEVPLNFRDARIIMQYLLPAISIMGVHHPDHSYSGKYVELESDSTNPTGDRLKIGYTLSEEEEKEANKRDKLYSKAMKKLGCYTLKKLNPGYGASIHYAGCLPFSNENKSFTLDNSGRLSGTQNVFIGDGSGFRYLPAKGITLSIMAYAHLAALNALSNS
jgi:hypothetical protein